MTIVAKWFCFCNLYKVFESHQKSDEKLIPRSAILNFSNKNNNKKKMKHFSGKYEFPKFKQMQLRTITKA